MGWLIALSVVWVALAARFVGDLLGYSPRGLLGWLIRAGGLGLSGALFRAGALLVCSTVIAGQFAVARHWSFSQQDAVNMITLPVVAAGVLCIILASLVKVRSRRRRP
jgi:hypothetical protein